MKSLFLVFTLALVGVSYAQTDEFNQQKYWKFRNTFVEQFVKIGSQQGESLPAGKRKPCNCTDNINYDATCFGEMHWGDGMITCGAASRSTWTLDRFLPKNVNPEALTAPFFETTGIEKDGGYHELASR